MKNTGAANLDVVHNGSWCYIIPVMATCSELSFRAERGAEADTGPGLTELSCADLPPLGDTSRIDSP